MNDNPSSQGLMKDADKLEIVREWIFRNYNDLVGHWGDSSHALDDEESSQISACHWNRIYKRHASMDGSRRDSQKNSYPVELLRKLEDLRLEISRIYNLPDRTANMAFSEDRMMHNSLRRPFPQPNPAEQLPYAMSHFGQAPYDPRNGVNMHDIDHHSCFLPNYPTEYQGQLKQSMLKPSYQFVKKSVLESPIRGRMDFGEDLLAIHLQESFPHPHLCSCVSCSQTYYPQFCSPAHQTRFGISVIPKSPSTSDLHHQADSHPIWPPHNIPSVARTPTRSLHPRFPGGWPCDFQSDMDNLRTQRRSLIVHQSFKKFCHPVAGGAPFASCPKCSQLLKLPLVFKVKRLSMQNLQCGACSKVFQFDLGKRKRAVFMQRKFLLTNENGFEEARNERNGSDSHAVKSLPNGIGNSSYDLQPEKSQHSDQRENEELNASTNQRNKSFTSVSSKDPILSNNVHRGILLQDPPKHKSPPKYKERNANANINSAPSVSSQELQSSNDVNSGRILEENSHNNGHVENQEVNPCTDRNGKNFIVGSVLSEEQDLSSNMIFEGLSEEESLKINQENQDLNDRTSRSTASSVALQEHNLADDVNGERILWEEPQPNDLMEHRNQNKGIVIKRETFTVSSVSSAEPNLSCEVTSGFDGPGASEESLVDNFSPAPLNVDTIKNHPESVMEIGQCQTRVNSHKENTINEPDVDFSFISCRSSSEFTDDCLSVEEHSQENVVTWTKTSSASFIRKNFEELTKDERTNVTINGHPITKQNLEKAETLAGKVLPGNYWYDYYGGFWGVMGEHCLGIIPSFIEEFNYPMQANCAAGNTDVFVNGRELRQLDLELLSSRGLPTTRNRCYKIDIYGTVYDDRTGEELESLGLLAPSVLKAKKGFGMGVPAKYGYSVIRR